MAEVEPDLRPGLCGLSTTIRSLRYPGASLCRYLYLSTRILNMIL